MEGGQRSSNREKGQGAGQGRIKSPRIASKVGEGKVGVDGQG